MRTYPDLALTKDPEGRATMGCSSGGAAAFTMGWFRPDLFHRIITYSATLADQQANNAPEEAMYPLGAAEYHSGLALIAAEPRKDLRIFLHAGEMDVPAILTGNQHTAAALKSKGYHYRFVLALSSGHCASTNYPSTLADTLVWMWRGYPGGAQ